MVMMIPRVSLAKLEPEVTGDFQAEVISRVSLATLPVEVTSRVSLATQGPGSNPEVPCNFQATVFSRSKLR